jgi:flagellin
MPLNSVNTNLAAQVALQAYDATSSALAVAQKRISTGYRFADATDDGAAFAVAQHLRGSVSALTAVNQQLGNLKGLVSTTLGGLTAISDSLGRAKSLLVDIADTNVSQGQRDQYVASYKALVQQVADITDGSSYNGQSLLGSTKGLVAGTGTSVIVNDTGVSGTISAEDTSGLANTLAGFIGSSFTRTAAGVDNFGAIAAGADQSAAAAALSGSTGVTAFVTAQVGVSDQLSQAGADSNFLDATVLANSRQIDSLNAGLGALVDADLSKESATLQSLQIRQQLTTQALSLANQSPTALLSLFR